MKLAMTWTLVAGCLAAHLPAQDLQVARAAARCDTAIPWITDGFAATDPGAPQPVLPKTAVDRDALLDGALERARAENKPVLWYIPRIEGPQIIRGPILDDYLRVVAFTDRAVAPLIASRFVPVRCAVEAKTVGKRFGIGAPEWIEPAFVVLKPDGTVLRRLDRIRTFNAGFFLRWLNAALAANGEAAEPPPAAPGADAPEAEQRTWEGIAALRAGDLPAAEAALGPAAKDAANPRRPQALYALAHAHLNRGNLRDAERAFRTLVAEHPDEPEAAQAAMNLLRRDRDLTPLGPAFHNYEDVFDPPEALLALDATSTARARPTGEVRDTARRAVTWLLRRQQRDGGFEDARYACCPNPRILPNVWIAATAAALAGLDAWQDLDPEAVEGARKRGEKYLFTPGREARGHNEECYADAFRLIYLARRIRAAGPESAEGGIARARMEAIVRELGRQQGKDGAFAHEYPNPFATAAVVVALEHARQAGAPVPPSLLADAAKGIAATRGPQGSFAYGQGRPARKDTEATLRNSVARSPMCERALLIAAPGDTSPLAAALDGFWKHLPRLEAVRTSDYHTDGQLAGFFFWHGMYFASEAIGALSETGRAGHNARMLEHVMRISELDGSFIDDHELGKAYGTGMALLVLRNGLPAAP